MAGDLKNLKSEIQLQIRQNKVIVYSKTTCPYCDKVKDLFKSLGVDYFAVELNTLGNGGEVQSTLAEITGQRTVPNVFINGQHVGGCDSTHKLHSEKRLLPMIRGELG